MQRGWDWLAGPGRSQWLAARSFHLKEHCWTWDFHVEGHRLHTLNGENLMHLRFPWLSSDVSANWGQHDMLHGHLKNNELQIRHRCGGKCRGNIKNAGFANPIKRKCWFYSTKFRTEATWQGERNNFESLQNYQKHNPSNLGLKPEHIFHDHTQITVSLLDGMLYSSNASSNLPIPSKTICILAFVD